MKGVELMLIQLTEKSNYEDNYQTLTREDFRIRLVGILKDFIKEIEVPPIVFYKETSETPVGYCKGQTRIGTYEVVELGFSDTLLDGISYNIGQIEEVIIHELAHFIANSVHQKECGHGPEFMKIVELLNGNQEKTLSLTVLNSHLSFKKFEGEVSSSFNLKCRKCGQIVYSIKKGGFELFKFFPLSQDDHPLPLTLGRLNPRSSCCNGKYDFIAESTPLIKEMEKKMASLSKQLSEFVLEQIKEEIN
jgi:hypothetical protein